MSSSDPKGFRFRESTRAPHQTQVRVRFERDGQPAVGATANLSMEGMFIQSDEPKPVGTLIQFEFEIEDQTVQGLGDVVWIRTRALGSDKPPGMGLQFRYIDPQSRDLIFKVVDRYLKDAKNNGLPQIPKPGSGMPTGGTLGAPPAGSGSGAIPAVGHQAEHQDQGAAEKEPGFALDVGESYSIDDSASGGAAPLGEEASSLLGESVPAEDLDLTVVDQPLPPPEGDPTAARTVATDLGDVPPPAESPTYGSEASTLGFDDPIQAPDWEEPLPAAQPGADETPGGSFDINSLVDEEPVAPIAAPPADSYLGSGSADLDYDDVDIIVTRTGGSGRGRLLGLLALLVLPLLLLFLLRERWMPLVGLGGGDSETTIEEPAPSEPANDPAADSAAATTVASADGETGEDNGEAGDPDSDAVSEDFDDLFDEMEQDTQAAAPDDDFGTLDDDLADVSASRAQDDVAAVAPTPAPQEPAVRATAPTVRVADMAAREEGGQSVVTIDFDGPLGGGAVTSLTLPSPPRLLVRVQGVSTRYSPASFASEHISGVRAGLHNTAERGAEIHFVFDLAQSGLATDVNATGSKVVVRVSNP